MVLHGLLPLSPLDKLTLMHDTEYHRKLVTRPLRSFCRWDALGCLDLSEAERRGRMTDT
jgi:hypothetical protein